MITIQHKDTKEHILFDVARFKRFKKRYNQAIRAKETEFMFDKLLVLVDYAKYVIEYVENVTKKA